MIVDIRRIMFDPKERLREDYGSEEIMEMMGMLVELGQLQDVLVRPRLQEEFPDDQEFDWVLMDGGRRILALMGLFGKGIEVRELEQWRVGVKVREDHFSDLDKLRIEFHANRDRKDFNFKETAKYVKRMHQMLEDMAKVKGEEWTVYQSSLYLKMGESTVYKYLQLMKDEEVFNSPEVQGADGFNTAFKKSQIIKERKQRVGAAKSLDAAMAQQLGGVANEHELTMRIDMMVRTIWHHGDSRDWIRNKNLFPRDELFDWIIWDPPFGGEQDGGAFTVHERIDDSWEYARDLHADMLPELWRMLKDGRWMAIWLHPAKYDYMVKTLQGHEMGDKGTCRFCKKAWYELDKAQQCPKTNHPSWWVNPYPFIWFKKDRASDGHDIKRFRTNEYETFLLAAKWNEKEPILIDSSGGNVFHHPMVPSAGRRHVMHKPAAVYKDILAMISVAGEMGCDPGAGSGESVIAALEMRRRILACELSKNIHDDAAVAIARTIRNEGIIKLKGVEAPMPEEDLPLLIV